MMTRGRLTKSEKYVIEGMGRDGYSVADIAKELGRTKKTVKNYQEEKNKGAKEEPEDVKMPETLKAKDLIVNKTAEKSRSGVSVFTRAASERSDESKRKQLGVSRTSKDAIFKPLDN